MKTPQATVSRQQQRRLARRGNGAVRGVAEVSAVMEGYSIEPVA